MAGHTIILFMIKVRHNTYNFTPYLTFNRNTWAKLHKYMHSSLTKEEIIKLQCINEDISLAEVLDIYLPLSSLLNYYISFSSSNTELEQFMSTEGQRIPYIIGITGSVAVGKSTTARVLQSLLSHWPENRTVDLITTDSFLYPNHVLKERDLLNKKGFPQSYDIKSLINFLFKIKSGVHNVTAPVYSHLIYDIVPYKKNIIDKPDIMLIEGLNILQSSHYYYYDDIYPVVISDFIDFSIYIDAPQEILKKWYIKRFLTFCKESFYHPNSYFYHYAQLSEPEAIAIAKKLWLEINVPNLEKIFYLHIHVLV
ncbi:Pantothenate kinase [Candidatus Palibaumannia cicadellinicola]|uniref:Pantothenate kinase n=1 Tax=Candidatus Palibaumannia cicadellinicola TaxID=186490 RepID=A0A0K2BL19_9GAMM|nr:Pantothenate kinase [Candidatus Baumannia cicadellinicola]